MNMMTIIRGVERNLLVTLFTLMVALFFFNVLARSFLGQYAANFSWIEELVRIMNLFLVFGALGLALERGRQVGIATFRQKLPEGLQRPLMKLIDLTGLCFSCQLCYLSYGMVTFVLYSGQSSPTLGISMAWLYVAPLVGFALLALRFALSLLGAVDRFSLQAGGGRKGC